MLYTRIILLFYVIPFIYVWILIRKDHKQTNCIITLKEVFVTICPVLNIIIMMVMLIKMIWESKPSYLFFGIIKKKK